MTDERVEPTREWLDALIERLCQFDSQHIRERAMTDLRDAILASQPERVECDLDGDGYCKPHGSWRCFPNLGEVAGVSQPERVECDEENQRYFREDNGYKFCPDCGQLLEGSKR